MVGKNVRFILGIIEQLVTQKSQRGVAAVDRVSKIPALSKSQNGETLTERNMSGEGRLPPSSRS